MNNEPVSLIIPGRNCGRTIGNCLAAVVPLLDDPQSPLNEIIFVDDGSTDDTPRIVGEFPVRLIPGTGSGAGAARNLGWRAASNPLIWFVDSDCVAQPDALHLLLPHFEDARVGAVSGSYGIMNPESLLACLIHEEIIERHRRMGTRVDFAATFNVLYRRAVLQQVGGFDERYLKGQDAELSFRVQGAGFEIGFERDSCVKHYHPTRRLRYLATQRQQGYWRVWLHLAHPQHTKGDSYSSLLDHIQPPLAVLSLIGCGLLWVPSLRLYTAIPFTALLLAQVPLTAKLLLRLGKLRYALFSLLSFVRAYWRGLGMVQGMLAWLSAHMRGSGDQEPKLQEAGDKPEPESGEHPLVSVVIPTCNRREALGRCLGALAEQTYDNFEVVVVDDCSSDGTPAYLETFARDHPQLTFHTLRNEQHAGANPSRNRGIRASSGEFIAFLDSDCVAESDWLTRLVRGFTGTQVGAVTGLVLDLPPRNIYELTFKGTHRQHRAGPARRLVAGNMCVRRRLLEAFRLDEDRARPRSTSTGQPDIKVSARGDEEGLFLRLRAAGYHQLVVPDAVVTHEHHLERGTFFRQAFRGGRSAARLVFKYYLPPRLDLLPFLLTYLTLPLAMVQHWFLVVPAFFFSGALSAVFWYDLTHKGKALREVLRSFPLLVVYYQVRLAGYVWETVRLRLRKTELTREHLDGYQRDG